MTHDTDCRVLDEHRELVNEIARAFYHGDGRAQAKELAADAGWEQVGSGVGRIVYRIPVEQQAGDVTEPVHEQPCVIKFAVGRGHYGGQYQNREEIQQYNRFPDDVTHGGDGVPVVVPISDWDHDDHLWLTMPEVDAETWANHSAAEERLQAHGWKCNDVHSDNVGMMHNEPVILDYGVDCEHVGSTEELAAEFEHALGDQFYEDFQTRDDDPGHTTIGFFPADWVLDTDRPPLPCEVHVVGAEGISGFTLRFGHYTEGGTNAYEPDLGDAANDALERFENEWNLFEPVWPTYPEQEGGIVVTYQVDFPEPKAPEIAAEMVSTLISVVHEEFPGGEVHPLPEDDTEPPEPDLDAAQATLEEAIDQEINERRAAAKLEEEIDEKTGARVVE